MARYNPPKLEPANLSLSDVRNAIPKLKKRIEELESFNIDSLTDRYDPRIEALENKIDDTLVSIFGKDTANPKHVERIEAELKTVQEKYTMSVSSAVTQKKPCTFFSNL